MTHLFQTPAGARAADGAHRRPLLPPSHIAHFYSSDALLLVEVARPMAASLADGGSAVAISTPDHRIQFEEQLRLRGFDPQSLASQGRWLALDARDTLDAFMVNGWPDEARFAAVVGPIIDDLAAAAWPEIAEGQIPVSAYGEMVAVLWEEGNQAAAIRLERLWNILARTRRFHLSCGWPLRFFSRAGDAFAVQRICAEHTHVTPEPETSDRQQAGVLWQLKSKSLLNRASLIARRTLGFYPDVTVPQEIDVPEAINEIVTLHARSWREKRIEIATGVQAGLRVEAIPGEFREIVAKLLTGAIDNSPVAGHIWLRAWRCVHPVTGIAGIRLVVAEQRSGASPQPGEAIEPGSEPGIYAANELLNRRGTSILRRSRAEEGAADPSRSGSAVMVFLPIESRAPGAEGKATSDPHPSETAA